MPNVCLGVNVDHVATLRQARQGLEPSPIYAALEAELAGASSIVLHLREDRRHIQEDDLKIAKNVLKIPINLEMALIEEIIDIALLVSPYQATLVPEKRQELTTEGGLDLKKWGKAECNLLKKLASGGIKPSAFIDPDPVQVVMVSDIGFRMIEVHTGRYAECFYTAEKYTELNRIVMTTEKANELGLEVAAGHGLNYQNVKDIASINHVHELNIGHSIVSRGVFVGIGRAVKDMLRLMHA